MKTNRNSRCRAMIVFIATGILAAHLSIVAHGQTLEFDGGLGYAAVDMTAWAGTEPYDWGQMTSYYGVNLLFPLNDVVSLGGGVRHQYLFWYDIRYLISGTTYVMLTREVAATRIAANARFNFSKLFVDLALGPYLFDGFTDFSATGSFGYNIRLTDKLALPIRASAGMILDAEASIIPVTAGAGLAYRFN